MMLSPFSVPLFKVCHCASWIWCLCTKQIVRNFVPRWKLQSLRSRKTENTFASLLETSDINSTQFLPRSMIEFPNILLASFFLQQNHTSMHQQLLIEQWKMDNGRKDGLCHARTLCNTLYIEFHHDAIILQILQILNFTQLVQLAEWADLGVCNPMRTNGTDVATLATVSNTLRSPDDMKINVGFSKLRSISQ